MGTFMYGNDDISSEGSYIIKQNSLPRDDISNSNFIKGEE